MAMLLFSVGDNRYVIDNRFILRIIPHVALKKLPYTSSYVIGLFNFSGKPLPIIDFCQLIEQRAAKEALDSRIIILWNPDPQDKHQSSVGIIGEKVTTIVPLTAEQFNETGFHLNQFPYLDGVYSDQEGVIQKILVPELFNYLSQEFFNFSKLDTDEL